MNIQVIIIFILAVSACEAVSNEIGECRACNCQFNNVQVLDRLIESRITTALNNSGVGTCQI